MTTLLHLNASARDGATWSMVWESVIENKTVENIECLLKTAKETRLLRISFSRSRRGLGGGCTRVAPPLRLTPARSSATSGS